MGYGNQKYVTALTIMNRLARIYKNKQFTIDEIVEWCTECETEVINDIESMRVYTMVILYPDSDKKAIVPCNMWRLRDVITYGGIRYNFDFSDGVYLRFASDQTFETDENGDDVVYVNYHGIAVDEETGYPLIKRGHELACEAYCVWKLHTEDFTTGKIPMGVYQTLDNQKMIQCEAAKSGVRFWTPAQLKQIHSIIFNALPRFKEIPQLHLNCIEE